MYNRKYARKTVIAKQETEGFSNEVAKTLIGTIEIKNGRGKINVDNKEAKSSKAFLVVTKNGENYYVDLGQVGSVFDPDNVAESEMAIEDFDILVVGGINKDNNFPWWVFVGYMDKKREWRRGIKNINEKDVEEVGEEIEVKEIEEIKEIKEVKSIPAIERLEPLDEEKSAHNSFKKIVENFKVEMSNFDKFNAISINDIMGNMEEKKEEVALEDVKLEEVKTDRQYIFENNEEINPFDDGRKWVRTCPEEIWCLDIKDTSILSTSFVICADKKYSHVLLGEDFNNSLILAVPDCFSREDRNKNLKMGFVDFWSVSNEVPKDGVYGYWIKKLK